MTQERKPWLFVKRLQSWNPLLSIKPLLAPPAPGDLPASAAEPEPGAAL